MKRYIKACHLVFVVILTLNISARWLECFSAFHGGLAHDISMRAQPTLHTSQLRPYCCPLNTCSSTIHHTEWSAASIKYVPTSINQTSICIIVMQGIWLVSSLWSCVYISSTPSLGAKNAADKKYEVSTDRVVLFRERERQTANSSKICGKAPLSCYMGIFL